MIYIFYGQDDYSLQEELARLQASLEDEMLPTNTTLFEGAQATPQDIANACETMPLLGGYRLVLVNDLLQRFEGSQRSRNIGQVQDLGPWRQLVERVANLPPSTLLIFTDGDLSPSNPLLQALSPHAQVQQFRPLRANLIPGWIQRQASEKGLQLSPQAIRLLADSFGSNLWALRNELEKLASYAPGRRIEEDDVRAVMGAAEINIFSLVDAVAEGRTNTALRQLRRLVSVGVEGGHLLALLVRQYRLLLLAKDGQMMGLASHEIANRIGVTSDFVFQKVLEQAALYTLPQLKQTYRRLLQADLSIKRGQVDEELALELLIADLAGKSQTRLPQHRA